MTKDEAKQKILAEWSSWASTNAIAVPRGADALAFFGYLQGYRSELLAFRSSGDKWQVVHGWLLNARLISDR